MWISFFFRVCLYVSVCMSVGLSLSGEQHWEEYNG